MVDRHGREVLRSYIVSRKQAIETRNREMNQKTLNNYSEIAAQLWERRIDFSPTFPKADTVALFLSTALATLFPHFEKHHMKDATSLEESLSEISSLIITMCEAIPGCSVDPSTLASEFIGDLPLLHDALLQDAHAICNGDPASTGSDEIILTYPGFYAIAIYRIAHWFYLRQAPLLPRLMTELAHSKTGIDIHPAAKIAFPFVIDHGTGIVIGESTEIQANVKIYQGVTLGALSVSKNLKDTKRHPTIEENVVVYANATILGGKTIIGANSVIGGNVWLTSSVPKNSRVYHDSKQTRSFKD